MTQTHLPPQWEYAVLALVRSRGWTTGQFEPEALRLLRAWATAEGGNAQWNPLNTTERYKGSWNYNTTGVQNYSKPIFGVMATVATLVNGYYNGILGFLQNPQITAEEAVQKYRGQFQTWGTTPDHILEILKEV